MNPTKGQSGPDFEERTVVAADWAARHTRELTVGALVLVAIVVAGWIYARSGAQRALRAEEAFGRAAQAAATSPDQGKAELAQVIQRYGGTGPGDMALIMLAEGYFEDGKFEDGLRELEAARSKHSGGVMAPAIRMLIGAGYEGTGKPAQAAEAYLEAARLSDNAPIRQQYQASAARAYASAGNKDAAIGIWRDLADSATGRLAGEARMQLGMLEASTVAAKAPG